MKVIAGLGNPGPEYEGTRHNAGFDVIDRVAQKLGAKVKTRKFGGLLGEALWNDEKIFLLKPQGYMNRSGQPVATILGFYKLKPSDLLVVTDDMALEPGRIRLRARGSAGGHNGLSDIIEKLGGSNFPRLRVGVGSVGSGRWKDYVLGRPSPEQREPLEQALQWASEAVLCWLEQGISKAMTEYNSRTAVSGQEKEDTQAKKE